jgi:hypothetical protein
MTMPIDFQQRADFYDSIFHSRAVVGISTSAMIEAAIIGRPVLTILDEDYYDSQLGALHFPYLLEAGGGAVRAAPSLDEHLADLSAVLADPETEAPETARRFVARFVRPHGLERAATPILVDALEQLGTSSIGPERDPFWVVALRRLIALVSLPATPGRVKLLRRFFKRIRRLTKRIRRFLFVLAPAIRTRLQRLPHSKQGP